MYECLPDQQAARRVLRLQPWLKQLQRHWQSRPCGCGVVVSASCSSCHAHGHQLIVGCQMLLLQVLSVNVDASNLPRRYTRVSIIEGAAVARLA